MLAGAHESFIKTFFISEIDFACLELTCNMWVFFQWCSRHSIDDHEFLCLTLSALSGVPLIVFRIDHTLLMTEIIFRQCPKEDYREYDLYF